MKFMKIVFPPHSDNRKLLLNGFIACRLVAKGASASGRRRGRAADEVVETIWVHIGLHYLKPFRSTFQLCKDLPDHVENNDRRIVL